MNTLKPVASVSPPSWYLAAVRLIVALLTLMLLACSSATSKKAKTVEVEVSDDSKPERPRQRIEQQIGGLNHEAVSGKFNAMQREVQRCIEEGMGRLKGLGGVFTVSIRVKLDGRLRHAFMKESTLGDRQTERCILDAAMSRTWPKPKGGEGEAEHTYAADAVVDVHSWDGKRMRGAMGTIMKKVWKCVSGVRGRWTATVYLRHDGQVVSAGVAPPSAGAEAKSDCVVDVLESFRFGPQRSKVTKVTFALGW
jgi:hypothetical protein